MLLIRVNVEGDGVWPDLADKAARGELIHLGNNAPPIQISSLDQGITGGKPSVSIRLDLPDGKVVIAETSLALFQMANAALRGKYGDVT